MFRNNRKYKKEVEAKSHPVDKAWFVSTITLSWLTSFLWRMRKRGPTLDHLWKTPPEDECEVNHERFLKIWKEEQRTRGKNASVKRACFSFIRNRAVLAIITSAVTTVCDFVSYGIIFRMLMIHITKQGSMISSGLLIVAAVAIVGLFHAISYAATNVITMRTGIRLRSGVVFAVFKKAMRKPPSKNISIGEMINICSNDGDRLYNFCERGQFLISGPVTFICAIVYMGILYGWIGVFGCCLYLLIFPFQYLLAKKLGSVREELIVFADQRIKLTSEVLTSIKLIKMYSWEEPFKKVLFATRKLEMKCNFVAISIQCLILVIVVSAPAAITTCVMLTAIATGQHMDSVEGLTIFCVIQVVGFALNSSPIPLRDFVEGLAAMGRYQCILDETDFKQYVEVIPDSDELAIEVNNGSFDWSDHKSEDHHDGIEDEKTKLLSVKKKSVFEDVNCLNDINLQVKKGSVIGICGSVGSGKSSLFYAILGQLFCKSGRVRVQGKTGYCSQSPWIMNSTIRENILFGADYDEVKYNRIIKACCLIPDLATFNSGDLTEVGEHGINLSGGQKQRVSLARAVYRNCDVYLLDDPLSAVDTHVGKSLFGNVIMGLLRDKTVLLTTHQLQYLPMCGLSLYMKNGSIAEIGSHEHLISIKGKYFDLYTTSHKTATNGSFEKRSLLESGSKHDKLSSPMKMVGQDVFTEDYRLEEGKLMQEETSSQVNTTIHSYVRYISTGGYLTFFVALITCLTFSTACQFNLYWLTKHLPKNNMISVSTTNSTVTTSSSSWTLTSSSNRQNFILVYIISLLIVLILGVIQSLTASWFFTRISTRLHNLLFQKVIKGTMEFFETTPTGRILNRFQKDLDLVDTIIPFNFELIMFLLSLCILYMIVIGVVFPFILLVAIVIFPIVFWLFSVAVVSVRQTQRLDNLTRTPWISHIVTSCSGVSTILSYRKVDDYIQEFQRLLDINSSPYYIFRCIITWMMLRTGLFMIVLNSCCALFMVVFVNIDPALRGMAMSVCLPCFGTIQWIINDLFFFDSSLVALDRIGEYIDNIPEEKQIPKSNADCKTVVDKKWPNNGKLEFSNVKMRYRQNLPLALKGVSFCVDGNKRVGVVGRTGSGKSSLAVSLFRLVDISSGKILLDDVDISTLPLTKLRSVLNSIPQDPTLFNGSIRYNLDPFDQFTSSQIWDVINKVHLREKIKSLPNTLDFVLSGQGCLSMGEMQLMCLGRAILRKCKVVVLDEATASIDSETDHLLKQTLKEHFSDSTLLIIAHRLHTVFDCDKVLVMDDGLAVEFGSPQELMEDKKSHFSKLVKFANF